MSTIQLERPTENTLDTPDALVPSDTEVPTPEDISVVKVPIGIVALHDLGIENIAPPQAVVTDEAKPNKEKQYSEGISQQTLTDLHTILSDEVHDPSQLGAARQRLEKGSLTERALAFSLDVLQGEKYEDPIYEDLPVPDTKDMTGIRSRRLAITDPDNSFLTRIAKDRYDDVYRGRVRRQVSWEAYCSVKRLAEVTEEVKEEGVRPKVADDGTGVRRRFTDENLTTAAADFVLEIADHLDADTIYKLISHVPNINLRIWESDRHNLEKVLERSQEPSLGDAYVCKLLLQEHGGLERGLQQQEEAGTSQDTIKQTEREARNLQNVLARANQSRGYTANELAAIKSGMSTEDFNALHTVRKHLYWSTPTEEIKLYKDYVVKQPKTLEVVQKSDGHEVLKNLSKIMWSLGLEKPSYMDIDTRDSGAMQAGEQALAKLIDFVSNIEDTEKQAEVIRRVSYVNNIFEYRADDHEGTVYRPKRLEWLVDEVPELLKTADIGRLTNVIRESILALEKNTKKFEFGENSEDGRWLYIQRVLTGLEGLPKEGRAYEFLIRDIMKYQESFKSSEFMEKVIMGESDAVLAGLAELDKACPDWLSHEKDNLFDKFAKSVVLWQDEEILKPLFSYMSELKTYNLDEDLKSLANSLLNGTEIRDDFGPLRILFKQENHQVLRLMYRLNVPASAVRGFGVATDRLDTLRPIAQKIANHPIMTLLTSQELRSQGKFVQNLLTSENPMQYADALYQGIRIFGDFNSETLTDMLYAVYKGGKALEVQDDYLKRIAGEGGQAGIDKLNAALGKFRDQILKGNIDIEMLEESRIHLAYFKALSRYETSYWGSHYDDNLLLLLKREQEKGADQHRVIDGEAYVPSEILHIAEIDREKSENFEITKDGIKQWEQMTDELSLAIAIVDQDRPDRVSEIVEDLNDKVQTHLDRLQKGKMKLEEKLATTPTDKRAKLQGKLEELESEIEEISEIDEATLMNPTLFLRNVAKMSRYKDTHSSTRKALFVAALTKYPDEVRRAEWLTRKSKPNLQDLQELADLVQHTVNQETWGEVFTNFGLYKSLDQILNVNAINENIQRGLNVGTAGTRDVQLMPTRGLLMELSGHIGDACWASRYESIEDKLPNFTSVIMVQKPGTKDARFVGTAMLIEAKDNAGEPVLVIRGLNPIQNTIEQLDPQDFFAQFSNYAKSIAQKRGMKLAVVIDDHCGGSATNRPALFEFLRGKVKPTAKSVQLADDPQTTFNGYNIQNNTYLI